MRSPPQSPGRSSRFALLPLTAVAMCLWLCDAESLSAEPGISNLCADRVPSEDLWRLPLIDGKFVARQSPRGAQRDDSGPAIRQLRPADVVFPTTKPIQEIGLTLGEPDEITPPDYAQQWLGDVPSIDAAIGISREWPITSYSWAAASIAYHPLYFEDVNLERYGYSWGLLQPAISSAHFFGNAIALPYHVVAAPPHECVYSLGFERPGSCAPYYWQRLSSIRLRGAAAQVAAVAGVILLFP